MNQKDSNQNDVTEKIEIFSTEDEKIKSFGELLTNDSSRAILQILMKEELTALELSKKTGLSLPLVIYHLNKMQALNIIQISKVGTNVKGQDMKFYKATKFAVVILPSSVSEKAKESKSLLRSFNSLYRFAGIAIAGIAAWFTSVSLQEPKSAFDSSLDSERPEGGTETELRDFADDSTIEESIPSVPAPEPTPEPEPESSDEFTSGEEEQVLEESLELARRNIEATSSETLPVVGMVLEDFAVPIIITISVIGIGLFLELIYRVKKSKTENPKI